MTLLLVVVAIGIVAGVAVLVARDRPLIADDPATASRLVWPPAGELVAEDLDRARFTVAVRGYRMDEVDRVLADAQDALAARDQRIAALERRTRSESPPASAGTTDVPAGTTDVPAGTTDVPAGTTDVPAATTDPTDAPAPGALA